MEEFYRNHGDDPDTAGKVVLDSVHGWRNDGGGGASAGGAGSSASISIPSPWFIVKTEIEPVESGCVARCLRSAGGAARGLERRRAALRETLLGLYRTKVAPDVQADVIYTFWVKHAICTDPTCKREVPLFKDYLIAHKTLSVRYHRDVLCPRCKKRFDWEIRACIADRGYRDDGEQLPWQRRRRPAAPSVDVCAGAGEAEGTPAGGIRLWRRCTVPIAMTMCVCRSRGDRKKERKKVSLTVLLCPTCEAVWQWRGALPDDAVNCPACGNGYDPHTGNVPANGAFECSCGSRDKIIESIRLLPQTRRLPVRPYAIQAYLKPRESSFERMPRESLFEDGVAEDTVQYAVLPDSLLLPKNGKFFKRFSASDRANLQRAENLWDQSRTWLSYPKSRIPKGAETARLLEHHYNHWHDMFAPRQLLALATLLNGVMAEKDDKLRETLLCAFSSTLEANNLFTSCTCIQEICRWADGSRVVRAPRLSTQIYNCGEQCIRHRKYCRRDR